jgi:hypothetical protein
MITSVSRYAVDEQILEAEVWMLRSAAAPHPKEERTMQTFMNDKTPSRATGPPQFSAANRKEPQGTVA